MRRLTVVTMFGDASSYTGIAYEARLEKRDCMLELQQPVKQHVQGSGACNIFVVLAHNSTVDCQQLLHEPPDLLCIAIDPCTQARTSFATISLLHSPFKRVFGKR